MCSWCAHLESGGTQASQQLRSRQSEDKRILQSVFEALVVLVGSVRGSLKCCERQPGHCRLAGAGAAQPCSMPQHEGILLTLWR